MSFNLSAYCANLAWHGSNLPACAAFRKGLRRPGYVQRRKLDCYLRASSNTAFGRKFDLASVASYEEYAKRVPLASYEDLVPWIDRIRKGEQNILTRDKVTHLAPTSGTSGGCKLIPFTRRLQSEFSSAVAVWISDLYRQQPELMQGRAYWSVTPSAQRPEVTSPVPVGFDEDAEYLGSYKSMIVDRLMAVPGVVRQASSIEEFWYATALSLLRCPDLRLISVWHPSFLVILLDFIESEWTDLREDLRSGTSRVPFLKGSAMPKRAASLEKDIGSIWRKLSLVSCWGDAAAKQPCNELAARLPGIPIQRKGVIATEGFVSLPFEGAWPLAIGSHFFEFIDGSGNVLLCDSLKTGEEYQVVLTTAGGLWRYRLGDRITVIEFVENTPSIRFLGRSGNVSDLFGEKLTESFVTEVLRDHTSSFAMLAPDASVQGQHYTLFTNDALASGAILDEALKKNPHYRYCRELGQLNCCRMFVVSGDAHRCFMQRLTEMGTRLGDIKPARLSRLKGWSRYFSGDYVSPDTPGVSANRSPHSCRVAPASADSPAHTPDPL